MFASLPPSFFFFIYNFKDQTLTFQKTIKIGRCVILTTKLLVKHKIHFFYIFFIILKKQYDAT